jgi:hypothetical protein
MRDDNKTTYKLLRKEINAMFLSSLLKGAPLAMPGIFLGLLL